jgi:3-oxoacyl-[acyl-carrier-protein] synthase-1
MKRVFVTGMGVISSIGIGIEANATSLREGKSGIKTIKNLDSIYRGKYSAAEIDLSNDELADLIPHFDKNKLYTRGQLLSLIAVNEALTDAKLSRQETEDISIIAANTIAAMDIIEKHYSDNMAELQYYFNQAHSSGETSRRIANYIKSNGLITTITTACSSSANAIILGSRLIRSGRAKRVLVGGSDPITKFSLNGFASLLIYDEDACKPFDKNRKGLNLGEAGAFLVLESEDVVGSKQTYGEVLGFSNRNEAYHATASSPEGEGAQLCIQEALKNANLTPNQIDFVHAHGTATPNNDESELNALKQVFSNNIPPFCSTKSYVGHTLGAAGSLNAIYTLLAMKQQFLFKNLNFNTPIEKDYLPITQTKENTNIKYALSNAFGFGGNISSIVFANTQKGADNA